ncbi:MAG: hypothetical protein ACRYFV_20415 [Janthinobacterium lividum]
MLANVTPSALATTETSASNKLLLVEATRGLTHAKAAEGRKLLQIKRDIGELSSLKITIFILKQFADSVKVPTKLDGADIIELAEEINQRYPYESFDDLILALKNARSDGTIFYNKLDQGDIWKALHNYFENKSKWLENQHLDQKSRGGSNDYRTVALLGEVAPKLTRQLGLRIDPAHPNADLLRRKLNITNAKEQRGLMTPDEAEQSRAAVAKATMRKQRADWQPSEEAQKRIDARNRQEDKRL